METNRRNFFRKIGQLTCLSALVGGTAYLYAEDRIQLRGCSGNQFCKNCQKMDTCVLDPAKEQRESDQVNRAL